MELSQFDSTRLDSDRIRDCPEEGQQVHIHTEAERPEIIAEAGRNASVQE